MIVSCPACSARYRIDPGKIKGRGAKITCPRCSHKFVVYKDGAPPTTPSAGKASNPDSEAAILDQDFRKVGITWRVRQGMGVTYSFHDLRSLLSYLDEGKIGHRDSLSHDSNTWVPLDSIDNLEAYFRDTWRRAERGDLKPQRSPSAGARPSRPPPPPPVPEQDEEAPTTIMGQGHALMDDIRKAVAEATTPPPSPNRDPSATFKYPPTREASFDDPTTFSGRSPRAGYTPRTDPQAPASNHDALGPQGYVVIGADSSTPAPVRAEQAAAGPDESDSTGLLILAALTLLLLGGVTIFGLWYTGILIFPSVETSAPAAPLEPPTDSEDNDGATPAPSPGAAQPAASPSQLIPGDEGGS